MIGFGQTQQQLNEIKKRGLDIESLKSWDGNLNIKDGDGGNYRSMRLGDYDDPIYFSDVCAFYSSKLLAYIRSENSFSLPSLSEIDKVNIYLKKNIGKEKIIFWENKEWTSAKILIENIELWDYLVKLK